MTNNAEYFRTTPNDKPILDRLAQMFEGRFFAVGNPYTNEVWGKVGTFNAANDELMQMESSGNAGNATDILEVDADGVPLKKAQAA